MIAGIAPAIQQPRIPYGRHLDESGVGYQTKTARRPDSKRQNTREVNSAGVPTSRSLCTLCSLCILLELQTYRRTIRRRFVSPSSPRLLDYPLPGCLAVSPPEVPP